MRWAVIDTPIAPAELTAISENAHSPEHINDGAETQPSARLGALAGCAVTILTESIVEYAAQSPRSTGFAPWDILCMVAWISLPPDPTGPPFIPLKYHENRP